MTRNQIDYWRLQEDKRHARNVERETERANRAKEKEQRIANRELHLRGVQANTINATHYNRYDSETARHNREMENQQMLIHQRELAKIELGNRQLEQQYANMRNQKEIAQISAAVGYANVGAAYANVAEQQRAHMAQEKLTAQAQQEIATHNRNLESLQSQKNIVDWSRAQTQSNQLQFEKDKWDSIGYARAVQDNANAYANMQLTWAQTELAQTNKQIAPVNAVSNLIGSGANVIRAIKGGSNNAKPKPKIEWPDGTLSY